MLSHRKIVSLDLVLCNESQSCYLYRVVWFSEMEAYTMECGGMARDQVQAHSTSVMEMCSRVHGGMMSGMERFVSFLPLV